MGEFTIKLPDVGEGIAEAELTAWHVKVGDIVREDDIIAEVMTEKAAVEIPTEVTGKVIWLGGEPGEMLAIGSDLARIEVEGEGNRPGAQAAAGAKTPREPASQSGARSPSRCGRNSGLCRVIGTVAARAPRSTGRSATCSTSCACRS